MKSNQLLKLPVVGAMAAAALLAVSACGVPDAKSDEGGVQKPAGMGLGTDHSFRARSTFVDERGQSHVRYDHFYRGVRVWQGDTIVHSNAAGSITTGRVMADIRIGTNAALSARDAVAFAHRDLQPRGAVCARSDAPSW